MRACLRWTRSSAHSLTLANVNRSIVLDSAEVHSSPASGILITARITNRSGSWTVFPADYGAIGYAWTADLGQWEVAPSLVRLPDTPYLLGPLGGSDAHSSTVVYSPGMTWPGAGPIRLVVQGRLRNPDELLGEAVAAFLDVPPPE